MLYIHKLHQLNQKSAEIESVSIIREIKQKTPYPINSSVLLDSLAPFYVSQTDIEHMAAGLEEAGKVLIDLHNIEQRKDPLFEEINVKRALNAMQNMPMAITNNLGYANEIFDKQVDFTEQITHIFNQIPKISNEEDMRKANNKLSEIFLLILRSGDFQFNHADMVHEEHTEAASALIESMSKGFLFHISLEEEVKKMKFKEIMHRIPAKDIQLNESIMNKVEIVNKAVQRAYELNKRQINLAVILYSYIKWLSNKDMH